MIQALEEKSLSIVGTHPGYQKRLCRSFWF